MNKTKRQTIQSIFCFVWFGMVLAISFLEAPVKFTAPSLTLPVAIDVGVHVFHALNKVELVIASLLLFLGIRSGLAKTHWYIRAAIYLLLLLQTFWLFPVMDLRAVQIIAGKQLDSSYHHWVYIIFEVCKIILLAIHGWQLQSNHEPSQEK